MHAPNSTAVVLALLATLAFGCSTRARSQCVSAPGVDAGPEAALVVGTFDGDTFVPLVDGGAATLVFGSQGGWMLVLAARLPAEWAEESCALVAVHGNLDMPSEFVDPVEIEVEVTRHADAVAVGTVPFFLGYDRDALVGRTLELVVTLVSRPGRAAARLSVVLRA